jgi:hypothetical protein
MPTFISAVALLRRGDVLWAVCLFGLVLACCTVPSLCTNLYILRDSRSAPDQCLNYAPFFPLAQPYQQPFVCHEHEPSKSHQGKKIKASVKWTINRSINGYRIGRFLAEAENTRRPWHA